MVVRGLLGIVESEAVVDVYIRLRSMILGKTSLLQNLPLEAAYSTERRVRKQQDVAFAVCEESHAPRMRERGERITDEGRRLSKSVGWFFALLKLPPHGHRRPTGNAASGVGHTSRPKSAEDGGRGKCGKAEPQEGGDGLGLATALLRVVGAVCDVVVEGVVLLWESGGANFYNEWRDTYLVAAGVGTELCGHGNGGAEEQEGVEAIKRDADDGRTQAVRPVGGYEIEEGQHPNDGDYHVVVDECRVAGEGARDDVAGQGHDEESPEELLRPGQQGCRHKKNRIAVGVFSNSPPGRAGRG